MSLLFPPAVLLQLVGARSTAEKGEQNVHIWCKWGISKLSHCVLPLSHPVGLFFHVRSNNVLVGGRQVRSRWFSDRPRKPKRKAMMAMKRKEDNNAYTCTICPLLLFPPSPPPYILPSDLLYRTHSLVCFIVQLWSCSHTTLFWLSKLHFTKVTLEVEGWTRWIRVDRGRMQTTKLVQAV